MRKVKVAIIGAGTSGLSARSIVAKSTDDYVVIDDGKLGTTCARVGCMPSKVFIQVANDYHRRGVFKAIGISGGNNLSIDSRLVMRHVRKLRDRFVESVFADMDSWKESHLLRKRATFIDKNTLDLGDEQIEAERIIIATGSRPIIPTDWQKYKDYFIDTNTFFELESLPQTMAVIGLGVIGVELGQAINRLGTKVIGIARRRSIGGISDPDLIDYAIEKLSDEMELNFNGVQELSLSDGRLVVKTSNQKYTVDKALVSVGRKPNIDGMGLEDIGLEFDKNGIPAFNSDTFQIEGSSIFIAGDVNGIRPVLHECADEGNIAGYNAVASSLNKYKRRTWLGITFADPNFASVGMTYEDLQKNKSEFVTGHASFEGQGRAIVMLQEIGLLKLYGCKKSKKLLGAELFAPSGEHLAHLIAWVIAQELTVQEILHLPFYHPVVEEGLRTALRDLAAKLGEKKSLLELALCCEHPTNNC